MKSQFNAFDDLSPCHDIGHHDTCHDIDLFLGFDLCTPEILIVVSCPVEEIVIDVYPSNDLFLLDRLASELLLEYLEEKTRGPCISHRERLETV